MPQFDKTGPNGEGPATGRGLGICKEAVNKRFRRNRRQNLNNKIENRSK